MHKQPTKGTADKMKGSTKHVVSNMTGEKMLQAESKMDKAKGNLHRPMGSTRTTMRGSARHH
jgi:uncharacterized protein YjbJ (UPF0337 family)